MFNDQPLENKLWKTINLEGSDAWKLTMFSDIQTTGFIEYEYFEEKEGSWFAFLRNEGTTPADGPQEFPLRSLNGLGTTSAVSTSAGIVTLDFPLELQIGNIISVGDIVYFGVPSGTPPVVTPTLMGQITQLQLEVRSGINRVLVQVQGSAPTNQNTYILYLKNAVAESHGILGHYGVFDIENNNTAKVELFAVETEAMKSFP